MDPTVRSEPRYGRQKHKSQPELERTDEKTNTSNALLPLIKYEYETFIQLWLYGSPYISKCRQKAPVKLIQWVKIAHSFFVCVKSVPLYKFLKACLCSSTNGCQIIFLKPTSKNGEICRFNRSLLTESFQLTLKFHSFIPCDMKRTCQIFIQT